MSQVKTESGDVRGCQYAFCQTEYAGIVESSIGQRAYCERHYTDVVLAWNSELTVIEEP